MKRLNYHHLLYFWTAAKLGSVSEASMELKLSQPTVSEQIHALERELGRKLFRRTGRKLELTEFGRFVFRYAERIFRLGGELTQAVNKATKKTNKRLLKSGQRNGSGMRGRSRR
jgi:LysR family transcriptional activator of nhaA